MHKLITHKHILLILLAYVTIYLFTIPSTPTDTDPINFVLALDEYNIAQDKPHPPGYPLYVSMGRLFQLFVDKQQVFPLLNLCLLLGTFVCLLTIASHFKLPHIGLVSGLLFITHPLTLYATQSGESYISDAFFGSLILAYLVIFKHRLYWQYSGLFAIFFCLSLFRAVSCAEFAPLALCFVFLQSSRQNAFRSLSYTVLVIGCASLMGYLLTMYVGGGVEIYSSAVNRVMGENFRLQSVFGGASIDSHLSMAKKLSFWLLIVCVPLIFAYLLSRIKQLSGEASLATNKSLHWLLLAWVAPPIMLFSLIFFLKPTYLLAILCPILICTSLYLFRLFSNPKHAWSIALAIVCLNLSFYYIGDQTLPKQFYKITHHYLMRKVDDIARIHELLAKQPSNFDVLLWDLNADLSMHTLREHAVSHPILFPKQSLPANPTYQALANQGGFSFDPKSVKVTPFQQVADFGQNLSIAFIYTESNALNIQIYRPN